MNISLILLEIEQCRAEMISLSEEHDLSSEAVICASKRLDRLLNKYRELEATSKQDHIAYSLWS